MYVDNSWLSLDCFTHTHFLTISGSWMNLKMADTSERRVFCNTILLKYHAWGLRINRLSFLKVNTTSPQ